MPSTRSFTRGATFAGAFSVLFSLLASMPAHALEADGDASACMAQMRSAAPANGVSVADFDRYTANAKLLASTVSARKGQPEGRETWWDYLAKTVDDERVAQGRAVLVKTGADLQNIGRRYDVDPEVLVAIFGIETNYGSLLGKTNVLDAWVTRACTETNPLWKKNVYASVRLLRDGTVDAPTFVGSWSGAFGMTQFIPTSFYELAADGDGDGRIDLYGSLPDALASTANHLRKRGAQWTHGLPAVTEVRLPTSLRNTLPQSADAEVMAPGGRRSASAWAEAGITLADGSPLVGAQRLQLPGPAQTYLFAPTGANGPAFMATFNFDAILHYNQSKRYALAVGLLINRIDGGEALKTPWPTDDPGLSRAEIKEVQTVLQARGYDVGVPDGIPGVKTRDAVRMEQTAAGVPADGRVGRSTLMLMRQARR